MYYIKVLRSSITVVVEMLERHKQNNKDGLHSNIVFYFNACWENKKIYFGMRVKIFDNVYNSDFI